MQSPTARRSSSDTGRSRVVLPLSVSWSSSRPSVAAARHSLVSVTSCGPLTPDRSHAVEQPAATTNASTKRNKTAARIFMRPPRVCVSIPYPFTGSLERSPVGDDQVDEPVAIEVEAPAGRIGPHLLGMPPDGFPEATGPGPHRGFVRRHGVGLLEQQHHLVLLHPDHHAPLEPELAGSRGCRELRPPREIGQDPRLEPVFPCDLLVECRQSAVTLHEPRHPHFV